ncbi:MAG: hypothetical protein ABFD96_20765, partial [Armatimonadia bacterium]
ILVINPIPQLKFHSQGSGFRVQGSARRVGLVIVSNNDYSRFPPVLLFISAGQCLEIILPALRGSKHAMPDTGALRLC